MEEESQPLRLRWINAYHDAFHDLSDGCCDGELTSAEAHDLWPAFGHMDPAQVAADVLADGWPKSVKREMSDWTRW